MDIRPKVSILSDRLIEVHARYFQIDNRTLVLLADLMDRPVENTRYMCGRIAYIHRDK